VRAGKLYKRYDAKRGKTPPPNFEAAQDPDPITGHHTGWIPVGDEPESEWHREAWNAMPGLPDGTYELCGPRLQGNPERLAAHQFIRHGNEVLHDCPRTFEALKAYLAERDIEGVVWHHPDGRYVKVKTHDFGIQRPKLADRPGYAVSGVSASAVGFLRGFGAIRVDGSFDVINACLAVDTLIKDRAPAGKVGA
jgi:hypothetical protein